MVEVGYARYRCRTHCRYFFAQDKLIGGIANVGLKG